MRYTIVKDQVPWFWNRWLGYETQGYCEMLEREDVVRLWSDLGTSFDSATVTALGLSVDHRKSLIKAQQVWDKRMERYSEAGSIIAGTAFQLGMSSLYSSVSREQLLSSASALQKEEGGSSFEEDMAMRERMAEKMEREGLYDSVAGHRPVCWKISPPRTHDEKSAEYSKEADRLHDIASRELSSALRELHKVDPYEAAKHFSQAQEAERGAMNARNEAWRQAGHNPESVLFGAFGSWAYDNAFPAK